MHAIETCTGVMFDYSDPRPEDVSLTDIAFALSNTCRFGGHVPFYSVAEHALLVRRLVIEAGHPELGLAALHHDSHEAYMGDVPTPLKRLLGDAYYRIADEVDVAVAQALDIPACDLDHFAIHEADQLAMRIEATALKVNGGRTFAARVGYTDIPKVPAGACRCDEPSKAASRFLSAHLDETGRV